MNMAYMYARNKCYVNCLHGEKKRKSARYIKSEEDRETEQEKVRECGGKKVNGK